MLGALITGTMTAMAGYSGTPLAKKLGVPVVVDFSGCPGDGPNALRPNWVTCPWPTEHLDTLKWQWDEVVTPYWKQHGKFAADHGVNEALYLRDPDGNGVELYCDRPPEEWPRDDSGNLAMVTRPLDVEALLREVPGINS